MNKILNFYQLIVFTNFKKKFYFLIFLSFLSIFAEMFGFIMVIPLTLTFLDSDKGIGVEYLDYLIFNIINNSYDLNPLLIIVSLISFFFIAKLILLTFSSYKIFSFSQTLGEKIANQTFFYELNKNYIDQYRVDSSQKIRRTLYDTLQLSSSLSGLIMMLSEIIFFILLLGLFLTINLKLFYPVLIIFLVALVYIRFSKNFIFKASQAQQKKYSDWLKFLQEGFGGIKMIKLNNSENFFSEMHAIQTSKYFLEEKKLGFMYIFPKIFFEFLLIVSFVLVIISTKFILNLPNETIIPILALFTVTAIRLIPSIYKIVLNYQKIVQAQPYISGVYEVFQHKDSNLSSYNHKNTHEIKFLKNINLSQVNFKYGSNKIFDKLNLDILKNEIIGIYGPSGSGKTTLIDLISGLIEPDSGDILVDGENIKDFKSQWQKEIGYVYQDTFIVDGNLEENIIFSKKKLINKNFKSEVINLLNLENIIRENGAGERGSKLSGGQKQRIGIARAIIDKPKLLILDEFTSSLDTESENEILEILKNLNNRIKTTIIMISHRKNPFKVCDKIYELKNHNIVRSKI